MQKKLKKMNGMQKRTALVLVMFLLLAPATLAANRKQITTFTPRSSTGTEGYNTDPFNVPGSEWRIDWSCVPIGQIQGSTSTSLSISAYPKGETGTPIAEISQLGSNQTNGSSYMHQGRGDYYLQINVAKMQSYTATVEYDVDSVATRDIDLRLVAAMILLTVIIIVAITVIFKRRKKQQPRQVPSGKNTRRSFEINKLRVA